MCQQNPKTYSSQVCGTFCSPFSKLKLLEKEDDSRDASFSRLEENSFCRVLVIFLSRLNTELGDKINKNVKYVENI